jgi:hypothetical protein
VQGVSDDDNLDLVLADEAGDGFQVGAKVGFGCSAVQGEERLGGEAEWVGDGDADAAIADIESEGAGGRHGSSVAGGSPVVATAVQGKLLARRAVGMRDCKDETVQG